MPATQLRPCDHLRSGLGALLVACVSLFIQTSAFAQDHGMERFTEPFSYVFEDPCLVAEPVLITGTTHIGVKGSLNANETRLVFLNPGATHATGVGVVTGDAYVFISVGGGASVDQYEDNSWVGTVRTRTGGTRFIRLGPEPDSGQWVLDHVTTNANGEVTSEFFVVKPECPPQ
jgi:hypothetical protein